MVFYDYTKFTFQIEGLNEVKIIQSSNFEFFEIQSDSRDTQSETKWSKINIVIQKWKIVMWHYLKLLLVCSILPCSTGTADQKRPNLPNNIFKPWLGTGIHWLEPINIFAIFEKFSRNFEKFWKISVGESEKRDSNFFKKRDFARACVEGFILTDRLISQKIDESSGSTATAVLIDHDQVYCVSSTKSHYVMFIT